MPMLKVYVDDETFSKYTLLKVEKKDKVKELFKSGIKKIVGENYD